MLEKLISESCLFTICRFGVKCLKVCTFQTAKKEQVLATLSHSKHLKCQSCFFQVPPFAAQCTQNNLKTNKYIPNKTLYSRWPHSSDVNSASLDQGKNKLCVCRFQNTIFVSSDKMCKHTEAKQNFAAHSDLTVKKRKKNYLSHSHSNNWCIDHAFLFTAILLLNVWEAFTATNVKMS